LLGLFFNLDDEGGMLLRNIGWFSTNCTEYIPEDSTLHTHRCYELGPYTSETYF
jgi:hypothetical protein